MVLDNAQVEFATLQTADPFDGVTFQAPVSAANGLFLGSNSSGTPQLQGYVGSESTFNSVVLQSLPVATTTTTGNSTSVTTTTSCDSRTGISASFDPGRFACGASTAMDIRLRPATGVTVVEGSLCLVDSVYTNPSADRTRTSAPCLSRSVLSQLNTCVASGNCTGGSNC